MQYSKRALFSDDLAGILLQLAENPGSEGLEN